MDEGPAFEWDVHNLDHIARHDVSREEVEQALAGDLLDLDYRVTEEGEDRWAAAGRTVQGRILVIVWTVREYGICRPITAYLATKGLEAIYRGLMD